LLLDTNALSDWAKSNDNLLRILPSSGQLTLPVVVIGEYMAGVYRSARREALEAWMRGTMRQVRIVSPDVSIAERYAVIAARLEDRGQPIPQNDIWIAALALEHRLPVLSRDAHFDRVDGLTRISW
jgi:tRNA(fMet)-specific endonuclease VapC